MCLKVIAKKKLFIIILFIIAFSIICGTVYLRADGNEVKSIKSAVVHFEYETTDVSQSLTKDETEILKEIFADKKLYKDSPSCGFSENISVELDGSQTFCIACDTCPIIYLKEKDKCFRISENEKDRLYNLLRPYGAFFPCV